MYDRGVKVQPKSRATIETLAWTIRKISGFDCDIFPFPIMRFLENTIPTFFSDFDYRILDNGALKDGARAITYPDQHLILIEEAVYDGACDGIGRDRMTVSHEVGHLFLHAGVSLAKNYEQVPVRVYEDSEWQADVFAGELLAPMRLIRGMWPEQIADECQISWRAAQAQFRALNKKLRCE